jgi:hypothetical protein
MTTPLDDSLSFSVVVGREFNQPIEVIEPSAALRIAVVERTGIKSLSGEWDEPGVYILLDRVREYGTWHVYVGKAPMGIRTRLKQQLSLKDHWYRAVLIRRDTSQGFHSGQVAWLEGRLYDLLSAAALSELRNEVRPVDDTLPAHEVRWLENAVEPIARLLRLLGHDCATESESLESDATGSRNRFYGVTVAKLIERGLLTGNEQLVSTFATVVASASICPDGTISYKGISFSSPSAAAAAARGGASNGWDMWAVPTANGKVKLSTYRARFLEK